MKQNLWLANSSLLLMFAVALGVYGLLFQKPSPWRLPKIAVLSDIEKKKDEAATSQSWEQIYQEDLFDTYVALEVKPVKQSLITPIPEPKPAVIPPIPEPKKQELIPPLTVTIRGIIATSDDAKNVAMIADETNKESLYYVGEMIKDAQIIKIAHNRVVLLRANGQQEVFYLRKDDVPTDQPNTEKLKFVIKKIDDQNYELDPNSFAKEVETLGNLIKRTAVIGTVYQSGKPLGIRLGKFDPNDLAGSLGLMEYDIITTVNEFDVSEQKNRIKAYDVVMNMELGDTIKIGLKRNNQDVFLFYKLATIERPRKKKIFTGIKADQQQVSPTPPSDGSFKQSKQQQREQTLRDFSKIHPDANKHQQAMMEIRRRILENMQNRMHQGRP